MAHHLAEEQPKAGGPTVAGFVQVTDADGRLLDWYSLSGAGSLSDATVLTIDDETLVFPNSVQIDVNRQSHTAFGPDALIDDNFWSPAPGNQQYTMSIGEEFTVLTEEFVFTPLLLAAYANPGDPGVGTNYPVKGLLIQARSDAANTWDFNSLHGAHIISSHAGSGDLFDMYGINVYTSFDNAAATLTNAYGANVDLQAYGTATNAYGLYVRAEANAGSTITNVYGINIRDAGNGGAVTNNYGLYVADQTGNGINTWNIYSAGAASLNEFEGDVTVGGDFAHEGTLFGFYSTAPVAQQDVVGAKAGNVALTNLLVALAAIGIITDSTT